MNCTPSILWSLASFLASSLTVTPKFPVGVLRPCVLLRDDADYVVGLGVGLAAAGRQGDAPDELPHLGRDDHRVADPEVQIPARSRAWLRSSRGP